MAPMQVTAVLQREQNYGYLSPMCIPTTFNMVPQSILQYKLYEYSVLLINKGNLATKKDSSAAVSSVTVRVICSDEGLMLKMSALESLYSGQITFSTLW